MNNSIIENLRFSASLKSKKMIDIHKIEAYLNCALKKEPSTLCISKNEVIHVSNVSHVGGGYINEVFSFLLTCRDENRIRQFPMILKLYAKNIDLICKSYRYDSELRLCAREWDALTNLEHSGFQVPKPFFHELDPTILGYPFLIIAQISHAIEVPFEEETNGLASSLAELHNLPVDFNNFSSIKAPIDGYEFATRLCSHFKKALYLKENQSQRYKKSIDLALKWLEKHANENYCPNYSLIHGDPNGGNLLFTNEAKPTLIDWECVDIGDPAYDLGIAYHMIKFHCDPKNPDAFEAIGQDFISRYMQESKIDVQARLKFYEVVGVLRCAIMFNSVLSSPVNIYREQHDKILQAVPPLKIPLIMFSFPFLRVPFVARQIGLDRLIDWLDYFERFVKTTCTA
ncbi:MAG: phosphotransferase [Candidatus Bathyarchaeia archaeon]